MAHIQKEKWITNTFARCKSGCDVLREPIESYGDLPESEKKKIRQTQVEAQEIIQVLGFHSEHALIMKWDHVIGWLSVRDYELDDKIKDVPAPVSKMLSPSDFFDSWRATPYVWGGVTRAGIDCSGFTQRYFLDVHDKILPKNSKDQRKSGKAKHLDTVQDHDLVFCHRLGGSGVHHVGIFFENEVWHAHVKHGVICQTWDDFRNNYVIEEITSHL